MQHKVSSTVAINNGESSGTTGFQFYSLGLYDIQKHKIEQKMEMICKYSHLQAPVVLDLTVFSHCKTNLIGFICYGA